MAAVRASDGDIALETEDIVEALTFAERHAPDRGYAYVFNDKRKLLITVDCT